MKFQGIGMKYFRSIGNEKIELNPLKKCTVLVGQNNSGKSNIIQGIDKISKWVFNEKTRLSDLEFYKRSPDNPFSFTIYFQPEKEKDDPLLFKLGNDYIFFDFVMDSTSVKTSDNTFAQIKDPILAAKIRKILPGDYWAGIPSQNEARGFFLKESLRYFRLYKDLIPKLIIIPAFRQIRGGEKYEYDGVNLIDLLGNYHTPDIGKDLDQKKFDQICRFMQSLLHLPEAQLEITPNTSKLIISNNGLRLPLEHYGTGVHELLILVTACLAIDNSIVCLEEPEVHLHPKLQRDFIKFLVNETSNKYIISTHSPAMINFNNIENSIQLVHVEQKNGLTIGKPINNNFEVLSSLRDLGVNASDLLQSTCVIWVEGVSDRNYVNQWIKLLAPDLIEGRDFTFLFYASFPRLNFNILEVSEELINAFSINQNSIFIADSDKTSKNAVVSIEKGKIAEECNRFAGFAWIMERREIENYIPMNIVKEFLAEIRSIDVEPIITNYKVFSKELNQIAKKNNAKVIDYDQNKRCYSKKISSLFTDKDIEGELRLSLETIINKIRSFA